MDIRALAAELLGTEPIGVRETSSPVAFYVDLPDERTVVAKLPAVGRPGSALVEAGAYHLAAARSVRVPAVLAVSQPPAPEWVVIEALPGVSLWSKSLADGVDEEAWRRVGAELRSLHEIAVPGFGPLVPDTRSDTEGGIRGEADAWCPSATYSRTYGIGRLVDIGVFDSAVGRELEQRYDRVGDALHDCPGGGRLLHGDLEGGHVMVTADGTYQGIIDFGQAQSGDPRWDLARVPLWDGDRALEAVLDGYGRDTLSAEDREQLLPLYLLSFSIPHAVRFGTAGEVDRARMLLERVGVPK